ncbi:MAG: hypothetical protein E7263_09595 [Lachnospiraceae bacterium]|nr:hypothetical protein [Lachnospiraceae bacterium]
MNEIIDVLDRDEIIKKIKLIVTMLSENKQGCCFGIDGKWGTGKTFLLDMLEEELKSVCLENNEDRKYFVFHYDCWKYDYYEEPVIAIVSSMMENVDDELSVFSPENKSKAKLAFDTAKKTVSKMAGEVIKNKVGIDWVEIASETLKEHDKENESKFDSLYGFKRALEEIRNGIEKITKEKTMIVVVDELDRCLPQYSIKVLERLHHIFSNIENVIVIISMDKEQLEHSIKEIYGNIGVDKYLRKFVSFMVELDCGKNNSFSTKYNSYFRMFEISENQNIVIEEFLSDILMDIDMRTQEMIFRKAEMIHNIIRSDEINDCGFLTFEVLYITVSLLSKSKNLDWVGKIWTQNYADQEKMLGKTYYNMLLNYGRIVETNSVKYYYNGKTSKGYRVINGDIISKTFFLINCMYITYNNGICEPYYYDSAEKEVEFVLRFKSIADVISFD